MELSGIKEGSRERGRVGPLRVVETDTGLAGRVLTLDWRLGKTGSSLVVASDGVRLCTGNAPITSCQSVEEGVVDALDALLDALLCGDNALGKAMASITPYGPEASDDDLDALLDAWGALLDAWGALLDALGALLLRRMGSSSLVRDRDLFLDD